METNDGSFVARTRVVSLLLLGVALIIGARLFYVQIVQGSEYARVANRQYADPVGRIFDRGSVYFTLKDGTPISAATLKTGYTLAIHPIKLEDPEETYRLINELHTVDREIFFERAAKKSDPYEEITVRIPKDTADKIIALDLPGLILAEERWRYYPGETLAAHVLGFVGYLGDELVGRYGIEQEYEEILARGENSLYENFFAQIFSNLKSKITDPEKDSGNVILTIEPKVELFLESKLLETKEKWSSDLLGGIIINPKTGAIYALGAFPTFDPNTYREYDQKVFANPLVQDVYELGSIVKPLTMAAGLDSGVVTRETTYNDKGFIELNEKRIANYDGKARGVVPMQEILNQSLNTGATFVALKMGRETFRNYMYGYGLRDTTGIDLPGEVGGLTDNLESTRDVEYATASFGQGIAVTPITMVRALSSLGNGGYLIKPHVTKSIDYTLGLSDEREVIEQGRVLKQATSEEITRMLVTVVDKALAGGTMSLPHYRVAAKTGTAQIADPENGGYYEDQYLHSFFGYFPAYDPEFLVFLYMVNPKGVRYASETLTQPFFDIAKFLINYYEIPPDR